MLFRTLDAAADAALAALVLIPLFFFLQKKYWKDSGRTVLYLLFALYLSGVYSTAGLPFIHTLTYRPRLNLRLFEYMFSDYRSSLMNVLFFVPLGFMLPLIWKRFRSFFRTALFGLGASVFIEAVQLFSPRATDVNDLVTNTAGAVIGYCLVRFLQLLFPVLESDNDTADVYWICGLVTLVMFLVHPLLSHMMF